MLSRNYNFKYFNNLIVVLYRLALYSKIVYLALENTRFGFEDIIDIKYILIIINNSNEKRVRCFDFSY